jgi:phosphoribosylglycinamide formyltransferase-1
MNGKKRVAILISGRGSNMAALISAARATDYPATIACVIASQADAGGLAIAAAEGVPAIVVDHKSFSGREAFEAELSTQLEALKIDLVACAGFMRIMSPAFVERWRDRMLNIHPSLLPAFKGLNTHARALAAGVKITGCTVHLVRAEVDDGPIIAQAAVPVLEGDSAETLAARVLTAEHRLYAHALALFAAGDVAAGLHREHKAQVTVNQEKALFSPPLEGTTKG